MFVVARKVWLMQTALVALCLSMVLSACAPAAAPAPQTGSVAPVTVTGGDVAREETLIIAFEGGSVAAPDLANPYISGNRINQGYHQAMIESLFYLNYETGELVPWLAEGYEFNEDFTAVTIFLRDGVTWNDGEAFNADDVVFTINTLKAHPILSYGGDMNTWVASVEKVDDLTVQFTLTAPYPRFLVT